jgi:CHAD domain-containing protein
VAKAQPIEGLTPELPYRVAAARSVRVRTEEVFDHAGGVLDTSDIERVHDMRVATRRLRAALEVYAPCFPNKRFKRVLKEVKALADALGARRDPDVQLQSVEELKAQLRADDAPGLDVFAADLRAEQERGNVILAAALLEVREADLHKRLLKLADAAEAGG